MSNSALLSLNTYKSDETSSSDTERTDKRNKSSDLSREHTQRLDETNVDGENIQSSSQNTSVIIRRKRHKVKKSKEKKSKMEPKKSKKKHRKDSSKLASISKGSLNEEVISLSNSPHKVKKHAPATAFSLMSYLKKPIEASHLSDYELEKTHSLPSSPAEAQMDSDNNFPLDLKEAVATSEEVTAINLVPNLKEYIKRSDLPESEQAITLSNSPHEVKKHASATTFSFSLISYLKEPFEASHLSDYELEKTHSLPSSPAEAQMDSDNNFPADLKEVVASSEEVTAINLVPNLKEYIKRSDLSESEQDQTSYLPSSSSKVKKNLNKDVLSNISGAIEVICLSDTDQEQADSLSNSPVQVKKQRDTSACSFSLIPYFQAANFLSEFELDKDNDLCSEHTLVEHDEKLSETNLNISGEHIQSSSQNTPLIARKRKPKMKNLENFSKTIKEKRRSLVSYEYLNISDCEESLEEGQCITDDDSLQAAKASCFAEFPQVFTPAESAHTNVPLASIPLPSSTDVHTPISSNLNKSYSMIKEDYSTPSSSHSRKRHSRTKKDVSTPSLKRRHSTTKEDSSTPSSKKSNLDIEYVTVDDNRDMSVNFPTSDNMSLLSIPPPPPPSEGTSIPFSFYKMFPPPSLKRSHSMIEEDSVNSNRFVLGKSSQSYNFTSSNSPIIKARRSLPARNREDFGSCANTTFDSSNRSSRHSSSFRSETPKRAFNFHDSSRRHSSYRGRNSHQSSYRSCATDQTPYSPADSYQRHKRFRPALPYYNVSELLTFQSDDGFIDSHCHLDFLFQRLYFDGSFKDYQRANEDTFPVCFKGCVAVFCNPHSFRNIRFWQEFLKEENVWASFGCHPHNALDYNDEVEESLLVALDHPKVRALGEIGLDYSHRNKCHKDIQQAVFIKQLKIALKKKLPLVIHCREAHDDALDIMKRIVPKNYVIHLHCFTDTWDVAMRWLQDFPNLYIGLTNLVTFPSAEEVHEVAKKISLARLLLETDAPYFVPRPISRQFNSQVSHPGMAIHVAAQIAALKGGIPLELVLSKTRQNTKAVYRI